VTAPAGIALASQDNVALGSEKKVDVVSGGDAALTPAATSSCARRAASARSRTRWASSWSPRAATSRLEAHQGGVEVKVLKRISLISSEAIYIEAPLVRIVSQGAQTEWATARSPSRAAASISSRRRRSCAAAGPAAARRPPSISRPRRSAPTSASSCATCRRDEPIPHQRYIAHLEDGSTIDGISDEDGRTSLVQSATLGPVRFELLP
jgi:type VI secretion system secreted protein VgrG